MRKIALFTLFALLLAPAAFAQEVYMSSHIVTLPASGRIFSGPGSLKRVQILRTAANSIQLFDSQIPGSGVLFSSFSLLTIREMEFDVRLSSGLTYVNYGTPGSPVNLTILYKGSRP